MENKELLTGRCKADFEEWYPQFYAHNLPNKNRYEEDFEKDPNWKRLAITIFHCNIPQEQQGVLREFFESKGILFGLNVTHDDKYLFIIYRKGHLMHVQTELIPDPDYSTAFTHAIDKACEIINGKEN